MNLLFRSVFRLDLFTLDSLNWILFVFLLRFLFTRFFRNRLCFFLLLLSYCFFFLGSYLM